MARNFLVMVKSGVYLVKFDGAETVCTKVPSAATHYRYTVADRIVCDLRERGFQEAMVATLNGLPATTQSILDSTGSAEYTVRFNNSYFFAGRDAHGQPTGSRDRMDAASMSQAAAAEIRTRLIRMGFKDAEVIEFTAIENSLENELARVWGSNSEPTPESITIA
jgi:hypothetical protein